MRCFKLETLGYGRINGKSLAIVDDISPLDSAIKLRAMIGWGESLKGLHPKNAEIRIEKLKNNGALSNLIGNTTNILLVDKIMKEIIRKLEPLESKIEIFPFKLFSSKGKLLSDELYHINPVGLVDCLDLEKSEIKYHEEDGKKELVRIKEYVFRKDKLEHASCIFKIPEDPSSCFIRIDLARELQKANCENLCVLEIKVS
ncbi:MAG TPA: DUF1629 domain-containing protein [Cyclobacteriaceae bacterium]|jgi:hypothetical protein